MSPGDRIGRAWARLRFRAADRCVRVGLALLSLLFLPLDTGGARVFREHDVKAAFLLNFARFVEWPPEAFATPDSPLVIGVVGENPFGDTLERTLTQQTAKGRPLSFRHFKEDENYTTCHVLFVSRNLSAHYDRVLDRVGKLPVLTVGETEPFTRMGGVIGFALVDDNVRFDINSRAAESARLKFSSKLLAVARSVIRLP